MDHPVTRVEAAEPARAGVQPFLEGGVQGAGPGGTAVARGDDLDAVRRDPEGARHRLGHQLHGAVHGLPGVAHRDDDDLLAGRVDLVQLPDPDAGDELADRAGVGDAGDHLGAGAGGQDIGEHPPRPRGPEDSGVPGEHQAGPVRDGLDQCGRRLHVELRGVQDDEQVQREPSVGVAAGALGAA